MRRRLGGIGLRFLGGCALFLCALALRIGSFGTTLRIVRVVGMCARFVPARSSLRIAERFGADAPGHGQAVPQPSVLASAVDGVDRSVVGARSCLERALAVTVLCRLFDHESTLRIGVDPHGPGLRAHAWVEHRDTVVVGRPVDDAYAPLAPLENV